MSDKTETEVRVGDTWLVRKGFGFSPRCEGAETTVAHVDDGYVSYQYADGTRVASVPIATFTKEQEFISRSPEVTQGRPEGPFQVGETVLVQVNQPCCASLVRGQEVRVERIANNADGDIYVRDCNGDTWLVGAEQLARPSSSTPVEGAQPVGSGPREHVHQWHPASAMWSCEGAPGHGKCHEPAVLMCGAGPGKRIDDCYQGRCEKHARPATPAVQPAPGPTRAIANVPAPPPPGHCPRCGARLGPWTHACGLPRVKTYATLLAKLEAEEGVKPLPTCTGCGDRAELNERSRCIYCYARSDYHMTADMHEDAAPEAPNPPPWRPSCPVDFDLPDATEFGTSLPGEARGTRR